MKKDNDRTPAVYIFIFFLLATGIAASGYLFYHNYETEFRDQAAQEIATIAQLKADGLTDWRNERLGDASFLFHNTAFSELVKRYFENPEDLEARSQLLAWLGNYQFNNQYDSARLLDITGVEKLSVPSPSSPLDSYLIQNAIDSLQSGEVTFLDFHQDDNAGGNIHLSVLAPIYADKSNTQSLGILILTIDPKLYLYPYLKSWPTESISGETLLVRREGEDALFLNEPRFLQNAALAVRFPLTNTNLPTLQAALEQAEVAEGVDYRNRPVLADMRAVPNSPWFLITKMDAAEVYAPLKTRLGEILGLVSLSILLTGASLITARWQQRLLFYRAQAEAANALREQERLLDDAQATAHVGSWSIDVKTGRMIWSKEMFRLYGLVPGISQPPMFDQFQLLLHPDDRAALTDWYQANLSGRYEAEFEHRTLPIQGAVRQISNYGVLENDVNGDPLRFIGTAQDITEWKQAEEQNRTQLIALESAANGIIVTDKNGLIEWINPAWSALTGYSKDEAFGKDPSFLNSGAQNQSYLKKMWDTILTGNVWRGELLNKRKDGTLYAEEETITPVFDEHGAIKNFIAIKQDITERKNSEEKIKKSNERFELIGLATNDAIWEWDLDGNFVWSNLTHQELFGLTLADPAPELEEWKRRIAPDQREQIWRGFEEAQASTSKIWHSEYQWKSENKGWISIYDRTYIERNEAGRITRMIGSMMDVTERKQAENALARTNLRLQSLRLIDHALLGAGVERGLAEIEALRHLAELVPCGKISMIEVDETSESAKVIARVADETLSVSQISEPVRIGDLRLEEMQGKELSAIQLGAGELNTFEQLLYNEGGRSLIKAALIVQEKLSALLVMVSTDPEFFTAEYLEVIKDVSTQLAVSLRQRELLNEIRSHAEELEKRVQERTAEIESPRQRLELAVKAGEIGVWEVKLKEREVVWDSRMFLIHGISPEHFDNSIYTWWNLIHPEDVNRTQKRFEESLYQTGFLTDEYRIVRPDGSIRYVSTSAVILYDASKNPERLIGVQVDTTNRKEAEANMQRANLEMARALRVKDEFLANMSHELRTPLNAVMGISESLLEQSIGTLNDRQKKYIATINESGAHLLSLINDILDLSKIEAGQMALNITDVSVQALFESGFRMVKKMAQKKNIDISFEADEYAHTVRGDLRRLLQILVNLLSNAVKFTPEGGRVGVQAFADSVLNEFRIVVWDTGIGIAEEDIPRLFQSFVQLDSSLSRKYSGTGLGLMLVMQMARMHGGNVSVQSKPNEGSQFTISLPWLPAEREASAEKNIEKAAPSLPLEKKRAGKILLVDDTESVTMLLSDYLQDHGYLVVTASDGLSGVEMAKNERPDLILMDIQMPGINGFEATQRLRAHEALRSVPIIALTAQAMSGDRERCLAAGMNDYISKPVRLTDLLRTIEQYLRREILP